MYTINDFDTMSTRQLVRTLHTAHGEMTRFKAAFILALARFEAAGLARSLGAPSAAVWVMRHLGVAKSTAFEYLRVGQALRQFALVAASFLAGEISYSVVRLLLPRLTPADEEALLALATRMTLSELERELAGTADRPDRPPTENLSFHVDEETGWLRFHGRLSPENGARLLSALKMAELASLRGVDDLVDLDEAALDAALAEAEQEPVAVEAELVSGEKDPRSSTGFGVPVRDNLLSSFLSMVNMTRSRPTNKLRTPGAQVNLLVGETGQAILPSQPGARTSDLVAAALNGDMRAHLLNQKGIQIHVSESRRLVSDAQVTALMAQWHFQCATPGCNHTRFIEFHHIVAHAEGGPTALWNLVPLCSSCHSLVTVGVLRIDLDGDRLLFRFPGGVAFASENRSTPMRIGRDGFRFADQPEEYAAAYSPGA